MFISRTPLLNLSGQLSSSVARIFITILLASFTGYAAELTVAAAADLIGAQNALASGFEKVAGVSVRFSSGASGILAKQVENGAPFDVFLSANEKFVKNLAASGKIEPSSVIVYASGRLGLWSKDGKIRDLKQLLDPAVKRVAIANPQFAPYGAAAKELLEKRGLWRAIQPKIIYGENVTQTFQYAESGNVDAAITSWTLLYAKAGVLLPPDHAPILQAGGVVSASSQREVARKFLAFLLSPAGRAILTQHGLMPP